MSAKTYSAAMFGLKPIKIEVEVDTTQGQPRLIIIGLPSQTVSEAKERITAALLNCGIRIKAKRTVVNLAPADLRKRDSCFELAIVASLLKEYGLLTSKTNQTIFFGELALSGELKPMKATLPLVLAAKEMGFTTVIIPAANVQEVQHVRGITIHPLEHLQQLLDFAQGVELPKLKAQSYQSQPNQQSRGLNEIIGHQQAKQALEIAAAGRHNLLMIGPPGSGKSLLARSIVSLLPPLNLNEATAVSKIHSLIGQLKTGLIQTRPFRAPHHSTSRVGLIGGGYDLHPGEISLAHHGVLFLDEINEFSRRSLEALREPLETGIISLTRSQGTVEYPAKFSLLAAANPCPCGLTGTSETCNCTAYQKNQYRRKLSGPLKDRIGLHLYLEPVTPTDLKPVSNQSNSSPKRERVLAASQLQAQRYQNSPYQANAELDSKAVRKYCQLSDQALNLLKQAASKLSLSTRSYFSVIKVAQTVADLQGQSKITQPDIAQALQFR